MMIALEKYILNSTIFGISYEPEDVLVAGFAKDDSYQDFITVQFVSVLDDQDKKFGMTRYYLDTSFAGGEYACISTVQLSSKEVIFKLNELGRGHFGYDQIQIVMGLTEIQKTEALKTLRAIFLDEPGVQVEER